MEIIFDRSLIFLYKTPRIFDPTHYIPEYIERHNRRLVFVEEGAGEREKDCNEKKRKKWYRL